MHPQSVVDVNLRQINHVRGHWPVEPEQGHDPHPERIARYNRQHRELYDSLRSRNVEASMRAITEHLERARADLLREDQHDADRGGCGVLGVILSGSAVGC